MCGVLGQNALLAQCLPLSTQEYINGTGRLTGGKYLIPLVASLDRNWDKL